MDTHGTHGHEPTNGTGDHQHPVEVSAGEAVAAVRDLVALMATTGVTELDLTFAGVSIRLRGPGLPARSTVPAPFLEDIAFAPVVPAGDVAHLVTAPMIGTFYTSPTPNEPPFVTPGDIVEAGQTVGIIEAMKIMNEIVSDVAGVVIAVIAANGRAVEYGSPLVRIAPSGSGES